MANNSPRQSQNPRLRAQAHGTQASSRSAASGANNPRRQAASYRQGYSNAPSSQNPGGWDAFFSDGSYGSGSRQQGYGANNPRPAQLQNMPRETTDHRSVRPLNTQYSHKSYRSYAEQRRQNQPGYTAESHAAGNAETASYYDSDRYSAKKQKKPVNKIAIVVAILAVVAIGVGVWFYMNPAVFSVSINGIDREVMRGTTIDSLISDGIVNPEAGDLLAVDGTLIENGSGNRFSATINGEETTDGTRELRPDDVLVVEDGTDATESYSTSELTVEPGKDVTGYGAIHAYLAGTPGVTLEKTGDVSGITVSEVESEVVDGGVVYYNADTGDDKVVALTFDDGPWPETTQEILDILKENNAKATFFTIGNQIADHADVVKEAAEAGHQICTHSWDHADGSGQGVNLTYMTAEEQVQEIQKGFDAIAEATGTEASKVIRTPGGNFYGDLIWTLEPMISAEINWNIDTEDWRRPGSDAIVQQILSAEPGDVILMHDGGGDRSQTVAALREALPQLVAKGYRFVTIDELMQLSPAQDAAAALANENAEE